MSKGQRIAALVVAAAVAIAGFVVFRPDGGEDEAETPPATQAGGGTTGERTETGATPKPRPPRPPVTRITVKGGAPVGGVKRVSAKKGETVRLAVASDAPAEVHVHGYDLLNNAAPGKPAQIRFKAGIEGVFEVELEGTHTQIARLSVKP